MPNSIPMSWLYILTSCIRVLSSFSFFVNSWCRPCTLGDWSFLRIMNSNGDSVSPWNIPLCTFPSTKILPPPVNSTLQVFMIFSISLLLRLIFCTFWSSLLSSFVGVYYMPFWSQPRPELDFSFWSCSRLGCADLCKITLMCSWIVCRILSVPQGTICNLLTSSNSLPLFLLLIFSTSSIGRLWVYSCLEWFL